MDKHTQQRVLGQCQQVLPDWRKAVLEDFEFDDPKGFSSFTVGVRGPDVTAPDAVTPNAVLFRQLEGKDNAILDFATEREVFLTLAEHRIAAECYHYERDFRVEQFYVGRTLTSEDLDNADYLRQIAQRLHQFHQLRPRGLPEASFFELLHDKWSPLAQHVLEQQIDRFPANEQAMCEELRSIYSPETGARVRACLPEGELTFCHNDTYHGNIMLLDSGEIKLLDFEFSCLNHKAYDFANLFAETLMQHKQPAYPYFKIVEREFSDDQLGQLINFYLDAGAADPASREREYRQLLADTRRMLIMSDYKYAMAALPLAVEPIQKIRFIPYALARYRRFLANSDALLAAQA